MRRKSSFFICLILFFILSFIPGCSQDNKVPEHLIGVWKTSAPKYADRYLKFSENFITFGIGEGGKESYYIRKIKTEQDVSGVSYTLQYEDSAKDEWPLIFVYQPDNGATIKFKNSADVWEKVDSG